MSYTGEFMIEIILFSVAFIGSLLAGLWDLKTTEIPDEIPTIMAVLGVFLWLLSGNLQALLLSVVFGLAFLGFGWLLYKAGQWGGGDAKLLSAIGFMLPMVNGTFFAIDFFFNIFIVGLIYMIIYSITLGVMHKGTFSRFAKNLIEEKIVLVSVVVFLVASLIIFAIYPEIVIMPLFLVFAALLIIFWRYSRVVESNIFKRKIPVAKLRIGDVLMQSKQWDGIDEAGLKRIKRSGKKFVVIKEGVRFGMVFPIALLVTYLIGNVIFIFVGM